MGRRVSVDGLPTAAAPVSPGPVRQTVRVIELGGGTLTCEQIVDIARHREPVRLADDLAPPAGREPRGRAPAGRNRAGVRPIDRGGRPDHGPADGHRGADRGRVSGGCGDLEGGRGTRARRRIAAQPRDDGRPAAAGRTDPGDDGRPGRADRGRPQWARAARRSSRWSDLLNTDRMPIIGRFNSLGTGDIAPLARLALTLPDGALDPGDGLALMSSNALTIGRAALAVVDLERLLAAATVVTALTFLARDGAGRCPASARRPVRSPGRSGSPGCFAGSAPAADGPPGCRTSTGCVRHRRPWASRSTARPDSVRSSPRWRTPDWRTRWSWAVHRPAPCITAGSTPST